MKLRKANAVFSLISTALLLSHAISMGLCMLSQGKIPRLASAISQALVVVFLIHAIICIVFMVISHKGSNGNKGKGYVKLNIVTIVQRISGVLMIVLTTLHVLGAIGVIKTPQVVQAIVLPLFFLIVLVHIAISTSKAFITLGVGDARFVKRVDIVVKVICAVTLIADVVGFYLYVC